MHVPGISCLVISHFAILVQIQNFKRGRGGIREKGYTMGSQTLDGKKLNFLPRTGLISFKFPEIDNWLFLKS